MLDVIDALGLTHMSTLEMVVIAIIVFGISVALFMALTAIKVIFIMKSPMFQKLLNSTSQEKKEETSEE